MHTHMHFFLFLYFICSPNVLYIYIYMLFYFCSGVCLGLYTICFWGFNNIYVQVCSYIQNFTLDLIETFKILIYSPTKTYPTHQLTFSNIHFPTSNPSHELGIPTVTNLYVFGWLYLFIQISKKFG